MKDNFERIADIFLDISIIALMLVSLFWNPPASKTQETPESAPVEKFDDRWAD